ncbi:hypothetical protein SAMN05421504_105709 [Amycolatopsis xylanica]|uniref:Uncharacterized protein n=1 Tax=Amycolatopsis xylanica TaxID=589385 RepID=A0A1H3K9Y7_9PSEU|nr:hypothetical protein [Amycolatopsis xylanica]SDY48996.1 hypothetical protein SAMN05421504_105709 [Amycolatopsis xylanica]
MTAALALITLILNGLVGVFLFVRWRARAAGGLPPLVYVHIVTALVSLALWVAYLVGGRPALLAWAVFALLTLANALGDTLLVRGWRARHSAPPGTLIRQYARAAREVLSGKRPAPMIHAILAPVVYFSVLLAALGVG